ncbi:glutaredoxin family protein [Tolypothrix campylonemoides VB511288]|nr:glutaredoxin family protein [Tolypothrix campylonemoides VB511288]
MRPHRSEPVHADFLLYQRDDCHLCDLALDVLAHARLPAFDSVFIDGDDALEARYGIRVPVLRRTRDGAELDWPFDAASVAGFAGEE